MTAYRLRYTLDEATTDEYEFAESLIAEAIHRVADRIVAEGGDPTLVPDDEWIKLVLREAGLA